jgi:hypothetical protein
VVGIKIKRVILSEVLNRSKLDGTLLKWFSLSRCGFLRCPHKPEILTVSAFEQPPLYMTIDTSKLKRAWPLQEMEHAIPSYCSWVKLGQSVSVLADVALSVTSISSHWNWSSLWIASTEVCNLTTIGPIPWSTYLNRYGKLYNSNSTCIASNTSLYTPSIDYGIITGDQFGDQLAISTKDVTISNARDIDLLYEYSSYHDNQFSHL